ncbi:hypothetical protein MRX96_045832 [Rhipicephalus microplus]
MVHQGVAKTPSDISPWSWADPLIPMVLRWNERAGERAICRYVFARYCPVRCVRIDRQIRAGVGGVQTTERFRAIADVLARPIGDFRASRFFEFPAMLDTKAISQIVEAVRTSAGTKRDEAAYLRCMLLGEIVATGDTIGRLTHVATATAIDAYTSGVERHVCLYGNSAPNGVIAAIDLSYFAALMTRKATYVGREEFGPTTGTA